MRGYVAIFQMRAKVLLQYKVGALAGVATQMFWGGLQVMIFRGFYANAASKEPLSLAQVLTFIWLIQALIMLIPWQVEKEIASQIKNGNVAYELIRPMRLYGVWLARSLAFRSILTLMRATPLFIFAGAFFGLSSPASFSALCVFCVSLLFALFLSATLTTLFTISLFPTLSGEGIQRLLSICAPLLSGMIVPLPLFPDWIKPFIDIQPFRGLIDIPSRLYTGMIPITEALYYLGFQLGWIVLLIFLGYWCMERAMRKIVIQGG